jgi:hypothetical protein
MAEQDNDLERAQPKSPPTGAKKPYHTPVLTVHGKIDEITLSGPGRRVEAGSGKSHP